MVRTLNSFSILGNCVFIQCSYKNYQVHQKQESRAVFIHFAFSRSKYLQKISVLLLPLCSLIIF